MTIQIGHGVALPPTVQGSQEWLDQRRGGIGGSDVAAPMGADNQARLSASPWNGPHDVYASKVHNIDSPSNIAMACGHELEALGVRLLSKETRLDIVAECGGSFHHHDYPWCRGSLDGIVRDDNGVVIAGAEIKTSSDYAWSTVPIYYVMQVQWYMFVLGLPRFYLGVILSRNSFDWFIVESDMEFQATLFSAALDFWTDHVLAEVPPPADWSDSCVGNFMGAKDADADRCRAIHTAEIERLEREIAKLGPDDEGRRGVLQAVVYAREIERDTVTSITANPKTRVPLTDECDALLIEREEIAARKKVDADRTKTINAALIKAMTHKRHEGSTHNVTLVERSALNRKAIAENDAEAYAACMVQPPMPKPVFSVQECHARYPELIEKYTGRVSTYLKTTEKK